MTDPNTNPLHRVPSDLRNEAYELLARHLPSTAVMVFDHDLRFVLVDGPEIARHGHSKAKLEGKLLHDAVDPAFAGMVEPNLRKALEGTRFRDELPFGELFYAYTYEPLLDESGCVKYALVMAQDTTALRQAEREAVRNEARIRSIVSSMPAVVFVIGADRRFRLSDGLGLSRLGLKPGEVVGRLVDDVYAGQTALLGHLDRALGGDALVADVPVGNQIWETRYAPMRDADGSVAEVVGVASEVTVARRTETSVRQSQRLEALGQLAAGVAHDFNNMLTVIMSAGQELTANLSGTPHTELTEMIVSAADRAGQLTRQLLSFARTGHAAANPVVLDTVAEEASNLLSRSLGPRIQIHTALRASGAVVVVDVAQLQSAILNLGINARDAMPDGGSLSLSTEVVSLDARACAVMGQSVVPGRFGQLTVADTGVGIPAEIIDRVFDPFFSTKAVGKGSGLGLAAVYGTVRSCGGAVTVESEPGRGTTFRLLLPLSDEAVIDPVTAAPATGAPSRGLILLVEDEPMVQEMAKRLLTSLGYDVILAKDGLEGVDRFRAVHRQLAAVICDGQMPRMSGVDAMGHMREIDPDVPIVFCTGYAPAGPDEVVGAAWQAFIAKPFRRDALAELLARTARTV